MDFRRYPSGLPRTRVLTDAELAGPPRPPASGALPERPRRLTLLLLLGWYFVAVGPEWPHLFSVIGPFRSRASCEQGRATLDPKHWANPGEAPVTRPCWVVDPEREPLRLPPAAGWP